MKPGQFLLGLALMVSAINNHAAGVVVLGILFVHHCVEGNAWRKSMDEVSVFLKSLNDRLQ